ncbi:MAG: scavenger receptor class F, member 2 [Ruegeria sp.]|uniref:scavenger receptor class F, member 2 n=1 Tax=Ruegeria sp. TaxID=1879320 RepID=UPI00349E6AA3
MTLRLTLLLALVLGLLAPTAQADFHTECRAGTFQCGASSCCNLGQRCSWDGFCIPPGGTYCGGGRSCGPFEKCVAGGSRCDPIAPNARPGSDPDKCFSNSDCPLGNRCDPTGTCVPSREIRCEGRVCPAGSTCIPGGGCTRPGWFLCPETGSQCRPGFKCSRIRGCVPVKAVDCGKGRWCRPGEQCTDDGGCEPEQTE